MAWVFAARFVDRMGKGVGGAPRDALIADLAPPGVRGGWYGLRQSLDTVGAMLGPLLAMGLMWLLAGDIRHVLGFAVIPAVGAVAILAWGVHEPRPEARAGVGAGAGEGVGVEAGATPRPGVPLRLADLRRLGPDYWWVVAVAGLLTLARFSEAFLVLRGETTGMDAAHVPAVIVVMNVLYAASSYPPAPSPTASAAAASSPWASPSSSPPTSSSPGPPTPPASSPAPPSGASTCPHGPHLGPPHRPRRRHRAGGAPRHGVRLVQPDRRARAAGGERGRGGAVGGVWAGGDVSGGGGVYGGGVAGCGDADTSTRQLQITHHYHALLNRVIQLDSGSHDIMYFHGRGIDGDRIWRDLMAAKYRFDGTKLTRTGMSLAIATVRGNKICEKTRTTATATIRGDKIADKTRTTTAFTVRGDKICKGSGYASIATMKEVDAAIDGPGNVVKAALWLYFVR